MILADTSVWIDYLRQGEPLLAEQLPSLPAVNDNFLNFLTNC
jgi:predicted nucleic acid-binding protein